MACLALLFRIKTISCIAKLQTSACSCWVAVTKSRILDVLTYGSLFVPFVRGRLCSIDDSMSLVGSYTS
jgi:hypothetical protein